MPKIKRGVPLHRTRRGHLDPYARAMNRVFGPKTHMNNQNSNRLHLVLANHGVFSSVNKASAPPNMSDQNVIKSEIRSIQRYATNYPKSNIPFFMSRNLPNKQTRGVYDRTREIFLVNLRKSIDPPNENTTDKFRKIRDAKTKRIHRNTLIFMTIGVMLNNWRWKTPTIQFRNVYGNNTKERYFLFYEWVAKNDLRNEFLKALNSRDVFKMFKLIQADPNITKTHLFEYVAWTTVPHDIGLHIANLKIGVRVPPSKILKNGHWR